MSRTAMNMPRHMARKPIQATGLRGMGREELSVERAVMASPKGW
jgi:hypothetical protein